MREPYIANLLQYEVVFLQLRGLYAFHGAWTCSHQHTPGMVRFIDSSYSSSGISGSPGSGFGKNTFFIFSNSGKMSGRLLGMGVSHSCGTDSQCEQAGSGVRADSIPANSDVDVTDGDVEEL